MTGYVTVFAIAAVLLVYGARAESDEATSWPVWLLCLFCIITVFLSAMYCGLTIGILGMDTIYLEIIAAAGQAPDRNYAADILPIRKLGHRLLVTLLLGNMLTLVVTSQLVAAIVNGSELLNFVVGTLVILLFGEILPMSICNNQNYALHVGSVCLPMLQISLVILYPVAKPLALLLDMFVKHGPGMVYDRQELKKLIRVHCDKYSTKSGIDAEQLHMMLSALEMNEITVATVMTPIDKAFMLEADVVLDADLQRKLWEYGKSRIPVYEGDRSHVIGLLYVKDLINLSVLSSDTPPRSLRDFLVEHPRSIYLVSPTTLVRDTLLIFENGRSQLLFVGTRSASGETEGTEAIRSLRLRREGNSGSHTITPLAGKLGNETHASLNKEEQQSQHPCDGEEAGVGATLSVLSPDRLREQGETQGICFVGIISLEDVIEQLIGSEIYDEDELNQSEPSWDNLAAVEDAALPLNIPMKLPRVNFYSYVVDPSVAPSSMSEDQKWALANYLAHSYVFFASWSVPQLRLLIDYARERVILLDPTGAGDQAEDDGDTGVTCRCYTFCSDAPAPPTRREQEGSPALYVAGQPSNTFTVLLSGGIDITLASCRLHTELRSFSTLGEEALLTMRLFVPDYTAVVSRSSRLLQISINDLLRVETLVNESRARAGWLTVNLTSVAPACVVPVAEGDVVGKEVTTSRMSNEDLRTSDV